MLPVPRLSHLSHLAAAIALLGGAQAFYYGDDPFWVVAHSPLVSTRLDPIVSPGGVSSHMHTVVGGNSFGPIYDYEATQSARCTSANVAIDRSNYWIPQVYRKFDNGSFVAQPLSFVFTTGEEEIYEFPPGFRMLAGNPARTTYNTSDPAQAAIGWECYSDSGATTVGEFPDGDCPDGLRASIYFPHCWDGVNAWLEGSAHVAYGEGQYDQGGACPSTHPKRIMGLFYEFIFNDVFGEGKRVLATGDDVGYSLHGDFANGWPVGFFQEIFNYGSTCSVQDAVQDCPALAPYVQTNGSDCFIDGVVVDEQTGFTAPIDKLPGNNPEWGGSTAKVSNASYVESAQFMSVVPALPSNWEMLGCIAEGSSGRALSSASGVWDDITPSGCMSFCADLGYSLAGVEYSHECYCGNSLSDGATQTYLSIGECALACPDQPYTEGYCGGSATLSLYQFTGSGSPSVVNTTQSDIAPDPTTIKQVLATVIRADSLPSDSDYNSAGVVETVTGASIVATGSTTSISSMAVTASSTDSASGAASSTFTAAAVTVSASSASVASASSTASASAASLSSTSASPSDAGGQVLLQTDGSVSSSATVSISVASASSSGSGKTCSARKRSKARRLSN